MTMELAIVTPLIGIAAMAALSTRHDPRRRARQEAVWREQIRAAGLAER